MQDARSLRGDEAGGVVGAARYQREESCRAGVRRRDRQVFVWLLNGTHCSEVASHFIAQLNQRGFCM